jgi:hypothetical protein
MHGASNLNNILFVKSLKSWTSLIADNIPWICGRVLTCTNHDKSCIAPSALKNCSAAQMPNPKCTKLPANSHLIGITAYINRPFSSR